MTNEEKEKSKNQKVDPNEEKKRKNIKAYMDGKMESYGFTKRSLYAIGGILGCFALTIALSITGTDFDPAIFLTWNYWVSMVIQYGIAIFSMITGRQIGDDTQRNARNGQYRRELNNYKAEYDTIRQRKAYEHFPKWLNEYREKKRVEETKELLADWGIYQEAVLDLDISELDNLSKPYRKDWTGTEHYEKYLKPNGESKTTFKSLTDEQIQIVKEIMKGAIKVPPLDPAYFMNALKGSSTDEWRRAAKADKKKGWKVATGYVYKLGMMLAISVALNGLVPTPYGDAQATTIVFNIVQRIFTMVTATTWGVFMGFKIVEMDMGFLTYKTYMLHKYIDEFSSGAFKVETIEEQANREYMESLEVNEDEGVLG